MEGTSLDKYLPARLRTPSASPALNARRTPVLAGGTALLPEDFSLGEGVHSAQPQAKPVASPETLDALAPALQRRKGSATVSYTGTFDMLPGDVQVGAGRKSPALEERAGAYAGAAGGAGAGAGAGGAARQTRPASRPPSPPALSGAPAASTSTTGMK